MPRIRVAVPEDEMVDIYLLARRISYAFHPLAANQAGEGIVTRKISDPFSIPGATSPSLSANSIESVSALTTQDRELLRKVLIDLPKLHSQMSNKEREIFNKRWAAHPLAPTWRPKLPEDQDRIAAVHLASDVADGHLKQLTKMIRDGALKAFDKHHIQSVNLGLNSYIRQEDALRYLEAQNFSVVFSEGLVAPPQSTTVGTDESSDSSFEVPGNTTQEDSSKDRVPAPSVAGKPHRRKPHNEWRHGGAERMAEFVKIRGWDEAEKKYKVDKKTLRRALERNDVPEPTPPLKNWPFYKPSRTK